MNAKEESERLVNHLLPLAKEMLTRYGEFYPYAAYMTPEGEIVDMGADDPDTEYPKSKDLIYVLRSSLEEVASAGQCRAGAIVLNVTVHLSESQRKSDAVQIFVDHVDGYSAEVFFPYEIVDNRVVYGQTFAQEGRHELFGTD